MSVDWSVVCDKCKQYHHLGQDMGGICSFGYGSKDQGGREQAGEFIAEHLYHKKLLQSMGNLRIVRTDDVPTDYSEEQR